MNRFKVLTKRKEGFVILEGDCDFLEAFDYFFADESPEEILVIRKKDCQVFDWLSPLAKEYVEIKNLYIESLNKLMKDYTVDKA